MSFNGLLVLLFVQIGIDVALIVVFFAVLRKKREPEKKLDKRIELFESLLMEADTTTQKFKERLDEKHRLIRSLNEELDKRILSLNVLLNRAEVLLSRNRTSIQDQSVTADQDSVRAEILEFARQGYKTEHIAKKLSMPKEEVKLVLDMRGKTALHER